MDALVAYIFSYMRFAVIVLCICIMAVWLAQKYTKK